MGVPVGENRCQFDETPLVDVLKDVIQKTVGDKDAPMAELHDNDPAKCCPVFVVATEGQDATGPAKLFRSFGFDKDPSPIWQAARATSAAPSYFPPAWVDLPPPGGWYIDGGLKRNNPSELALVESKRYWNTVKRVFIVSVGTGLQKTADFIANPSPPEPPPEPPAEPATPINDSTSLAQSKKRSPSLQKLKNGVKTFVSKVGGRVKEVATKVPLTETAVQLVRIPGGLMTLKRFAEELVKFSTDSEDTHRTMWDRANSHDESEQFPYYRFNVISGMDELGLEEWKHTQKIGALTRGYLRNPAVEKEMEQCARSLSDPATFESKSKQH
jgi:Patatin-like phospholipase